MFGCKKADSETLQLVGWIKLGEYHGYKTKGGGSLLTEVFICFVCVRKAELCVVRLAVYSDPVWALTAFLAGGLTRESSNSWKWEHCKTKPRRCESQFPGSASGGPRGKRQGGIQWGGGPRPAAAMY